MSRSSIAVVALVLVAVAALAGSALAAQPQQAGNPVLDAIRATQSRLLAALHRATETKNVIADKTRARMGSLEQEEEMEQDKYVDTTARKKPESPEVPMLTPFEFIETGAGSPHYTETASDASTAQPAAAPSVDASTSGQQNGPVFSKTDSSTLSNGAPAPVSTPAANQANTPADSGSVEFNSQSQSASAPAATSPAASSSAAVGNPAASVTPVSGSAQSAVNGHIVSKNLGPAASLQSFGGDENSTPANLPAAATSPIPCDGVTVCPNNRHCPMDNATCCVANPDFCCPEGYGCVVDLSNLNNTKCRKLDELCSEFCTKAALSTMQHSFESRSAYLQRCGGQ